jgi:hypothetical protein
LSLKECCSLWKNTWFFSQNQKKKGHYKLLKKGYIQYLTVLFMLFKNDTKRLIKSISQVLT